MEDVELSKPRAIDAIERCAIEDGDRRIVHCFIGTMGADWDMHEAVREVTASQVVGWHDSLFGRCLVAIMPDGRVRTFDTVVPE